MQTFLPLPGFSESAKVLDYRRLGKQRVEAWQILRTLRGEKDGWKNHPAVKMWKGYEAALLDYGCAMCVEWVHRGYEDNMLKRFYHSSTSVDIPSWIGDERFHSAHRAALLNKDFKHYSQFNWKEKPEIDYYWPTS